MVLKKKCICGKIGQMTTCDACKIGICRECANLYVRKDILYVKHDICLPKNQRR